MVGYIELTREIEKGISDGQFEFLDLDNDGWKELILASGCKAFQPKTLFLALDADELEYKEVKDFRYWKFQEALEKLSESNEELKSFLPKDCLGSDYPYQ